MESLNINKGKSHRVLSSSDSAEEIKEPPTISNIESENAEF